MNDDNRNTSPNEKKKSTIILNTTVLTYIYIYDTLWAKL